MSPTIVLLLINAAKLLVDPEVREDIKEINDAIDVLTDRFNEDDLLKKPDGSDWERQDVLDAFAELQKTNQEIRDLAKKPPADNG